MKSMTSFNRYATIMAIRRTIPTVIASAQCTHEILSYCWTAKNGLFIL